MIKIDDRRLSFLKWANIALVLCSLGSNIAAAILFWEVSNDIDYGIVMKLGIIINLAFSLYDILILISKNSAKLLFSKLSVIAAIVFISVMSMIFIGELVIVGFLIDDAEDCTSHACKLEYIESIILLLTVIS